MGGVSAFGYSGTIANAVLHVAGDAFDDASRRPPPTRGYSQHAVPWRALPHPFAQSQVISSDDSVFRSPTMGLLRSLVAHHILQGLIVFPGTGHLEMARAAFCAHARVTAGAELHGVYFLQPLLVEPGLYIDCRVSDGRFDVSSGELVAGSGSSADAELISRKSTCHDLGWRESR